MRFMTITAAALAMALAVSFAGMDAALAQAAPVTKAKAKPAGKKKGAGHCGEYMYLKDGQCKDVRG